MEVIAKTRNLRMSARKVRLVAGLVRGMDAMPALSQLQFMAKSASVPISKLLKSAMANAEHNFHFEKDSLFIKTITVDGGMPLKRWRARAFGRAAPIMKHSCHITIVLESRNGKKVNEGSAASKGKKHETHEGTPKAPAKEVPTGDTEGHTPETADARRQGKHRHNQNMDRLSEKGPGGTRRRIFNRKAG